MAQCVHFALTESGQHDMLSLSKAACRWVCTAAIYKLPAGKKEMPQDKTYP